MLSHGPSPVSLDQVRAQKRFHYSFSYFFSIYGCFIMEDEDTKPPVLMVMAQLLSHYDLSLLFAERTVPRFVDFYCTLD